MFFLYQLLVKPITRSYRQHKRTLYY